MNLLFGRGQQAGSVSLIPLRLGAGVIFKLHAELELDDEEDGLLHRYRLAKAPLVISNPKEDLKRAVRPGIIAGIVATLFLWLFLRALAPALFLGVLATIGATALYFQKLREQINVNDLLDGGRTFYCDSIIELVQKEAFLENICEYLRQVLESAKHWDDREIITIEPLDRAAAKLAVLKGA